MLQLRLTTILSGRAIDERNFERFAVLTIGRSPECEVHLDNLAVSRRHAEIRNEEGTPVLRDLGSGNGIDVNGVRVKRHALADGDVLTIGKFTLGVEVASDERARRPIRPYDGLGERTITDPSRAEAEAREALKVRAFVKDAAGVTTTLADPVYFFGRDADAAFPVKGGLLAALAPKAVAALLRDDDGYRAVDLTPKQQALKVNGAFVGDARLSSGDVVEVDAHRLEYGAGRPVGD